MVGVVLVLVLSMGNKAGCAFKPVTIVRQTQKKAE
jgi:hypothetical protein